MPYCQLLQSGNLQLNECLLEVRRGHAAEKGYGYLNRLNVATSRAKCICILVAEPSVFEVECCTPGQMQLANAFCRYLELATPI